MRRLRSIDPELAQGRVKTLLEAVRRAYGTIPNTAGVMANSPAVLGAFLAFGEAMGEAGIGEKLLTQAKLATSEANSCAYCASILTATAPSAGLSAEEILDGRAGDSEDRRVKAALAFAHDVLESRGKVGDQRLAALREAGFDDPEIVEILAGVVLGCFTNFLNNVADTELDIPGAEPLAARPAR